MAVSLNSVVSFNSTGYYNSVHHGNSMVSVQETKKEAANKFLAVCRVKASHQQVIRANIKVSSPKVPWITSTGLGQSRQGKRSKFHLVAAGGDNVATETSDKDSESIQGPNSNNGPSDTVNSSTTDEKIPSNGAVEESVPKPSSSVKRASLTARERLRAARVLSRYTETKASKPELGNKLLEALQETDKKGKKRSGLPQAPTDMFDDSKRGMPKDGWTFELPGGMDVFLIVFSFVFISSVMFATTYLVWKVGAIHFNEN